MGGGRLPAMSVEVVAIDAEFGDAFSCMHPDLLIVLMGHSWNRTLNTRHVEVFKVQCLFA